MKFPLILLSLLTTSWPILKQVSSSADFDLPLERSTSKHGRSSNQTGNTLTQRLKEIVLELKPLEKSSNFSQKSKGFNFTNLKERKIKSSELASFINNYYEHKNIFHKKYISISQENHKNKTPTKRKNGNKERSRHKTSSESKENSSGNEFPNSDEDNSKDSISSKESSSKENESSNESNKATKLPNLSTSSTVNSEITTQQTVEKTPEACFTSSVELQNLIYDLNFNLSVTQQQIHNITEALLECSKDVNKIQETIDIVDNLSILAHELRFIVNQLEYLKPSRSRQLLISMVHEKNTFSIRNEICGSNYNSLETSFDKLETALENCRLKPVMSLVKKDLYCTSQRFIENIQHVSHNARSFSKAMDAKYQEVILTRLLTNIERTMQHIKKVVFVKKMWSKSLQKQLDVLSMIKQETNTDLLNKTMELRKVSTCSVS